MSYLPRDQFAQDFRDRVARVKAALPGRLAGLLPLIAPGGVMKGNTYFAPNPARGSDSVGSFVVWTKTGAWKEYDSGEDEKGDVLMLIQHARLADSPMASLRWLEAQLGLGGRPMRPDQTRAPICPEAEAARLQKQAIREAQQAEAKTAFAFKLFLDGAVLTRDCPAALYLHGRGIDLAALGRVPSALRWDVLVHPETGELTPALLSLMSGVNGKAKALHRTFLTYEGGKYTDGATKMMLGPAKGAAVRLWRGETGLSPDAAAKAGKAGPLHLVEGIENALSLVVSMPKARVWALGSISGFEAMAAALAQQNQGGLPGFVSEIVLWPDNDPETSPAGLAFAKAREAFARIGPCRVARVDREFKDLNDCLRGIRRAA
jgi:hypothetical protein